MEVSHTISLENLLEEFCSDFSFTINQVPFLKNLVFLINYFNILHCVCVFCLFSFVLFFFCCCCGTYPIHCSRPPASHESFLELSFAICAVFPNSIICGRCFEGFVELSTGTVEIRIPYVVIAVPSDTGIDPGAYVDGTFCDT